MAGVAGSIPIGVDTRPAELDFAKFVNSKLSRTYNLKINVEDAVRPLGKISTAASDFEKSLSAANARVLAFGASVSALYAIEKAFTGIISSTIEVQDQLAQINVILNQSPAELSKFSDGLFSIAKNTGQSFGEVAKAAVELSRQGLGAAETLLRTNDALILTRLSGLDSAKSVEALTAAINSFSNEALNSTQIINKLANVDASFAVSSRDLAEALQRAGSSAASAGVSFDSFLALVTTVQQATQRGGAVIGNAFKTIFDRVQKPQVLAQLEALGVAVRSVSGEYLEADKILINSATTFEHLTQAQQSNLLGIVGNVYQANQLRALFSDLSKGAITYGSALDVSTNSTNQATLRNKELNETLKSQLNATFEGLKQLGSNIGNVGLTPNLEGLVKNLNSFLTSINDKESEDAGAVIGKGLIKGVADFIFGPGIVVVGGIIGKLGVDLAKFATSSIKSLLNVNSLSEKGRIIAEQYSTILAKEPELLSRINQGTITQIELNEKLLQILISQSSVRANQMAVVNVAAKNAASSTLFGGRGVRIDTDSKIASIPNFADGDAKINNNLDGVKDAVRREQAAGVPGNLIRVGTDSRLVNNSNPLGLGVYNLRDEPQGLAQGVDRAIRKGITPATHGTKAVVPGFAEPSTFRSTVFPSGVVGPLVEQALEDFKVSLRTGTAKFNELSTVLQKTTDALLLTPQSAKRLEQKLIYAQNTFRPEIPKQEIPLLPQYTESTLEAEKEKFRQLQLKRDRIALSEDLKQNSILAEAKRLREARFNPFVLPVDPPDIPVGQGIAGQVTGLLTNNQNISRKVEPTVIQTQTIKNLPTKTEILQALASRGRIDSQSRNAAISPIDTNPTTAILRLRAQQNPSNDERAGIAKIANSEQKRLNETLERALNESLKDAENKTKGIVEKRKASQTKNYDYLIGGGDNGPNGPYNDDNLRYQQKLVELNIRQNEQQLEKKLSDEIRAGLSNQQRYLAFKQEKLKNEQKERRIEAERALQTNDPLVNPNAARIDLGIIARRQTGGLNERLRQNRIRNEELEFLPNADQFREARRSNTDLLRDVAHPNISSKGVYLGENPFIRQFEKSITDPKIAAAEKAAQDYADAESQRVKRNAQLSQIASNVILPGYIDGTKVSRAKAIKELEREDPALLETTKTERNRRLTNIGFGLSFAAPIVTSLASQALGQETTAGRVANVAGSAASYAGLGSIFTGNPLVGGGVGAAAGLLIGIVKEFGGASDSLKEFKRSLDASRASIAANSDKINRFVSLQQQISDILGGRIKASPETLANLKSERDEILTSLPVDQQTQLGKAVSTGNFKDLSRVASTFVAANTKNSTVESFAKEIPDLTDLEGKARQEALDAIINTFGTLKNVRGETVSTQIAKYPDVADSLANLGEKSRAAIPYDLEDTEFGAIGDQKVRDVDAGKRALDSLEDLITALEFDPAQAEKVKKSFRATFGKSGGLELIADLGSGFSTLIDKSKKTSAAQKDIKAGDEATIKNADFGKILEDLYIDLKAQLSKSELIFESSQLSSGLYRENVIEAEKGNLSVEKLFYSPKSILERQKEIDLRVIQNTAQEKTAKVEFARADSIGKLVADFDKALKTGNRENAIENIGELVELIKNLRDNRENPEQVNRIVNEFENKNKNSISFNAPEVKPLIDSLTTGIKSAILESNFKQRNIETEKTALTTRAETAFVNNNRLLNLEDSIKYGGNVQSVLTGESRLNLFRIKESEKLSLSSSGRAENNLKLGEYIRDQLRGEIDNNLRFALEKDLADKIRFERPEVGPKAEEIAKIKIGAAFPQSFNTVEGVRVQDLSKQISSSQLNPPTFKDSVALLSDKKRDDLQVENLVRKLDFDALEKSGTAFAEDIQTARLAMNDIAIKANDLKGIDFTGAFFGELSHGKDEFLRDFSRGLAATANDLKGAFSGVLKELARGGDLKSVGVNLGYKLLDRSIDQSTNALLGSLTSLGKSFASSYTQARNSGGLINRYAEGGIVQGGSGIKDDVPALLSAGEFVINKKVAQTVGYDNLDRLNNGGISKHADGGVTGHSLDPLTKKSRISEAGVVATNQRVDFILRNTSTRVGDNVIFDVDKRLSEFAKFDPNNPANQRRDQLEQDIKAFVAAKKGFNKQRDGALQAAYISAAITIASSALSYGVGQYSQGAGQTAGGTSQALGSAAQSLSDPNTLGGYRYGQPSTVNYQSYRASQFGANIPASRNAGGLMEYNLGGDVKNYALGGSVDNIPAMLTGGEYVMSRSAVNKFGVPFFEDLNSGKVKKFANGGYSGGAYSVDSSNDSMTRLAEATDNLRKIFEEKYSNKTDSEKQKEQGAVSGNNVVINVTVHNSGASTSSEVSSQAESRSNGGISEKEAVAIGQSVRLIVLQEIQKQKRPGGDLYQG